MSKYNSKYKEIKKMRNVIPYESSIYKFLILLADYIVDSIISRTVRNPFREENNVYKDILSKHKFIFLQHGVIINNVAAEHNKYCYFPKGFVVSANPEYDSMLQYNYYYKPEEVWLTGLARFDYLYDEPKKYITIMPTWRKTLYSGNMENHVISDFIESDYYKYYNDLLNNEKLHKKLEERGYKLCLCIHPNFKEAVSLFENKYNNIIFTEEKYKDVYAWSNLIITDYSSAIFDFLYLRKPIIYTQFDKEEFFSSHICTKGYLDYEKDGFGEVEYTIEETVDRIIEYVENDCKLKEKYRERIDKFFAYNDKNNCKRIYEKIVELEKKCIC